MFRFLDSSDEARDRRRAASEARRVVGEGSESSPGSTPEKAGDVTFHPWVWSGEHASGIALFGSRDLGVPVLDEDLQKSLESFRASLNGELFSAAVRNDAPMIERLHEAGALLEATADDLQRVARLPRRASPREVLRLL